MTARTRRSEPVGTVRSPGLIVKKSRLNCGRSGGGLATGDADHAEHGDFAQCGTGYEDAVGVGVEVGRSDLQPVVHDRKQVVLNDTFKSVTVEEAQAEPKAVELGAAEEGFAFGLEIVVEITDKIDQANFREWQLLMFAGGSEQVQRVDLSEPRRV
jgi:hypothetical protein